MLLLKVLIVDLILLRKTYQNVCKQINQQQFTFNNMQYLIFSNLCIYDYQKNPNNLF